MIVPVAIRQKRRARALWLGALLACAAGPALAQAQPQTGQKPKAETARPETAPSKPPVSKPDTKPETKPDAPQGRGTLDDLFQRLQTAKNPVEAKTIATQIERRFARSGSDTVDLLAARANEVFAEGEAAVAIEIMDRAMVLKPDWAEGYHRRATMFFSMDDMTRAMADLNAALQRQPRHFGALTGMGLIFQRLGDQRRAFAAYAKAYEINPSLESVKTILDRMRPDVEGRDI